MIEIANRTSHSDTVPAPCRDGEFPDNPLLTVLIPTRNEAENIRDLLGRLGPAVAPLSAEILMIDDSDDDTIATVESCYDTCPVPVRVLHRTPEDRKGGLGSAVVTGARLARGEWIMVMDADLQHPPESAAVLAETAIRHDADIVVGTRYAGSGSVEGLDSGGRMAVSSSATWLAKVLFPRRLATVSDPMSGLFAFRADAIDLERLNPHGFKILLEMLIRHPEARVAEVAYRMSARHAGDSKASLREGLRFARHLIRLHRGTSADPAPEPGRPATAQAEGFVRQLARMLGFGAIGLSGLAVNTAALWLCYSVLGIHHLLGAALATQVSTSWNFLLVEALLYRGKGSGSWRGRAVRFVLMNNLLLLARLPVLQAMVWFGVNVLLANAVTLVGLFLARFLVTDRAIYGSGPQPRRDPVRLLVDPDSSGPAAAGGRKRSQYLPYRYDVAGTVSIGSQIVLPELEFFRAQWIPEDNVDISIRVGDVGPRVPRRRAAMTAYGDPVAVEYDEHLGRFGANFRVELGPPINVTVGPLLARSPHVVYTNIIEALLRFVMVSRGRMLLHSACISLDGVGVMLSARTDTGKTATILRLLRDHGGLFLSDDMTVVDADGHAVCFPKPLTISSHTLRAVQANDLTPREWRRLRFQSRLHSKGGRSFALVLAKFNVPIMSINALTQILVPPPKYTVDRLVPCRLGSFTRVEELFIIERGKPRTANLDCATTLERMIENTDDAYGFPPFRYLAPSIVIGGEGYQQLREREREILAGFLSHLRTRVIASDTFGWADEIPKLIDRRVPAGGPATAARVSGDDATGDAAGDPYEITVGRQRREIEAWPRWDSRISVSGGTR